MKSKGIPPKMALIQLRICNKFPRWTDHLEGLDIFWWGSFLRVGLKNSDFLNEQQNNNLNFPRTCLRNFLYFKGLCIWCISWSLLMSVTNPKSFQSNLCRSAVSREANIRPQLFLPPTGHAPQVPLAKASTKGEGWS